MNEISEGERTCNDKMGLRGLTNLNSNPKANNNSDSDRLCNPYTYQGEREWRGEVGARPPDASSWVRGPPAACSSLQAMI